MLPNAIRLASLVPILAGGAGALSGAGFLGEPAGPATGSHLRYLSGLLLGLGLLAVWCAADLKRRHAVFAALSAVVVLGGLARLGGLVLEGVPPVPHLLALVMELGVVPALWLWAVRASGTAPRPPG
jgi:peptidoglycan/LPS O-acetylase OafA/YrhL